MDDIRSNAQRLHYKCIIGYSYNKILNSLLIWILFGQSNILLNRPLIIRLVMPKILLLIELTNEILNILVIIHINKFALMLLFRLKTTLIDYIGD